MNISTEKIANQALNLAYSQANPFSFCAGTPVKK